METGATFKFKPFKFHKIEAGPGNECWLERDEALDYYRQMTACRIMENKTTELFNQKRIRGFCHQYIGQEEHSFETRLTVYLFHACVTGTMAIRDENDPVITSFRCHAWALLMGKSYEEVLCELTGHVCGNANGKGGSMHMYGKNFYGGNGIVGDQISLGAGLAFGLKYKARENVCFTLFGDGAANQGQFFEVCNMTKNWSLPIVFICENNKYAMYTPVDRGSAYNEFYDRVKFLPGIWADGMDVLAVREALRFARDYAASGYGPIIVELATYNYTGYSTDDPGGYRSDSEVEEMRKTNDPIGNFKEKILQSKLVSSQELEKIEAEITEEVSKASKVACEDRTLPKEALYTDIYKNSEPQIIRGITCDETIKQPYLYTSDIVKKRGGNANGFDPNI
ncbi:dehydrogenase e1 component domain-containing protein [Ditylenchus destructor]|uniref:pyruvate dehydrogenase (acetyl-transferring) n=1 Tax=Ditylenchus destructor TaxID=166010 RepID=A0AAD4MR89_9BILA|nr:dehydrogenase e1 component domain-containing protein [Ditylenchus destructor]